MKFRIKKYYDRYMPQVRTDIEWLTICSPDGFATIEDARRCCEEYKIKTEYIIVEEFEL